MKIHMHFQHYQFVDNFEMLRNGRQMGALCKIQTDRKIKNCLYFIRLKQKTRLSENRTKSMHFDKVGARINQQNQKS